MKKRYLLSFSYIGTYFKSCAKISKDVDTTTVVGALEWALKRFYPECGANPITISSRTDAGVHALENVAHVDLPHSDQFGVDRVRNFFNKLYRDEKLPLRISYVRQVSDDFNARRYAKKRTYLYRIAVAKQNQVHRDQPIPISELNRCHFIRSSRFDADLFQQALSLFLGTHDFTSFTAKPSRQLTIRTPVRRVLICHASQGEPSINSLYEPVSNIYDYWNVIIEGRSFNYQQVRRMVSGAISVAEGKYTLSYLKILLDVPNFNGLRCKVVPAHALYLTKVSYNPEDLSIDRKRELLNHTSTRVTTVEGKTLVEEFLDGEQKSAELSERSLLCPGFVVDSKPDLQVAEILPSLLYLGSQDVTQDVGLIRKYRITHILSVGISVPHLPPDANVSYNFIPAHDLPDEDIDKILQTALPLMNQIICNRGSLLVHCNAGVSRSPAVVIGYLIAHHGLSYSEANLLVKQRRPSSKPNSGFVKQLLDFERRVKK